MPKKKEEVYVADKNPFACLASDSDSDSDSSLAPAILASRSRPAAARPARLASALLAFPTPAGPASLPTPAGPASLPTPAGPASSSGPASLAQFRVWAEEAVPGASNVFSTPFTRASVQKRWNHPRFQEDSEGWTSISWTQPQFIDDAASEKKSVTSEEDIPLPVIPPQEFPSLLLRGTIDDVKETPAAVWAERVKKQLDKAEAARATRREGRLSFFRSSATQESV